jgi:hypothetical protein
VPTPHPPGETRRPSRWRALPGLLLLVLLAHLLLLQGMSFGEPPAGRAATVVPLQVRQIAPARPDPLPVPVPVPDAVPAPVAPTAVPGAAVPPPAPARRVRTPAADLSDPAPAPADEPTAGPAAEPALLLAAAPAVPAKAVAAPAEGELSVPVYPTRLPAPALLRYELQRGAIGGSGELVWRPAEGRYRMTMEGTVFGLNAIGWVSEGRLDAHGIAPERFVDRRRGRDARAANFQRDKGLITYSSVAAEHVLLPGAQDRLSFMLQLSAIVNAAPAKYGAGAQIVLYVAGARGEASVWTFSVESVDTVNVPAGRVPGALHLRREPRKPYDTRAELWLDPARAYLPVRVRLGSAESNESTDFLLREVATP